MFITSEELKSVMYQYQVTEITENDTDIAEMAISAAIEEMISYLRRYDTDALFEAEGEGRNQLLMELCKNIAVWYIVRLANVDMLYSQVRERYDRAIDYLKRIAKGEIAPKFPLAVNEETNDVETNFRVGSNPKFNHYFE